MEMNYFLSSSVLARHACSLAECMHVVVALQVLVMLYFTLTAKIVCPAKNLMDKDLAICSFRTEYKYFSTQEQYNK